MSHHATGQDKKMKRKHGGTEGGIDAIALIVILFGIGYWMAVELAR